MKQNSTCKSCYHYDVCHSYLGNKGTNTCEVFRDKRMILELPCLPDDDMYVVTKLIECHSKDRDGICHTYDCDKCTDCTIKYDVAKNNPFKSIKREYDEEMKDIGIRTFFDKANAEWKAEILRKELKERGN